VDIQTVPTYDAPSYQTTATLEGTTFRLSFQYAQRESCWYLSVADASGVDIYNGVKLICRSFLLSKCADPRAPAGDFYVFDQTGDFSPPGLEDLLQGSGRCLLVYVTSDLVAAIQSGDTAALTGYATSLKTNTVNTAGASTYGQE
jgi:hypothetical protein